MSPVIPATVTPNQAPNDRVLDTTFHHSLKKSHEVWFGVVAIRRRDRAFEQVHRMPRDRVLPGQAGLPACIHDISSFRGSPPHRRQWQNRTDHDECGARGRGRRAHHRADSVPGPTAFGIEGAVTQGPARNRLSACRTGCRDRQQPSTGGRSGQPPENSRHATRSPIPMPPRMKAGGSSCLDTGPREIAAQTGTPGRTRTSPGDQR